MLTTPAGQAAKTFGRELKGLSGEEVLERRRRGEGNESRAETGRSYLRIFVDNAFHPINVVLYAISIVLLALGLFGDALLTAGLVLGNVVIGVFQESRAKRQLEKIALLIRPEATVIREGEEHVVHSEEIVRGDYVLLRPGDEAQVDGRVFAQESCAMDEAFLTGESEAVLKAEGDPIYSGTFCMAGSLAYEADQVGDQRVAQQITAKAKRFRKVNTPLQREVGYVIWGMAIFVVLLGVGVINSFRELYGEVPLVEGTRAAAVVVSLVPQGLWVMITVTYGLAIIRMARSGALIQRMNAVESISHVDVLCLDKTGTLTTNRLEVEVLHPIGIEEAELRRLLGAYSASSLVSNRTNDAIASACDGEALAATDEVPFDSGRKWSALAFDREGTRGLFVLGAPEVLGPAAGVDGTAREVRQWTNQGLRVLLFACNPDLQSVEYVDDSDPRLPVGLKALGYVVLRDELRPEVARMITEFAEGGIELKVISGDNPDTVAALAHQAGFSGNLQVASGAELSELDPEAVEELVSKTTIFGRVAPEDKELLVKALQRRGRYVAMTGDGVNDVPALKAAQVAVAMRTGSPVTRNIADIVLLEDSFAALPRAFLEGQRIRKGMEGIIRLFLVRTLSVALIILWAALLAHEFPMTPRHTAILSTLTVGIPALALAAWSNSGETGKYLVVSGAGFVIPAVLTIGLMGITLYEIELARADVDVARTALTSATVLAGIALIPFAQAEPRQRMTVQGLVRDRRNVVLMVAMLLAFALVVVVDPLRAFYELTTLDADDLAIVAAAVLAWLIAITLTWRLDLPSRISALVEPTGIGNGFLRRSRS